MKLSGDHLADADHDRGQLCCQGRDPRQFHAVSKNCKVSNICKEACLTAFSINEDIWHGCRMHRGPGRETDLIVVANGKIKKVEAVHGLLQLP